MSDQPPKLDYRSPPERSPTNEPMSENRQLLIGFTLGVAVSALFYFFFIKGARSRSQLRTSLRLRN